MQTSLPMTLFDRSVTTSFGAIQRFFPDFFPSCYTERRQTLVKLYASAELDRLPERKKPGADKIFKL